jgi:D-alanyl-D-alanine carboxypeptidase
VWLVGAYIVSGNKQEISLVNDYANPTEIIQQNNSLALNNLESTSTELQSLSFEQLANISNGHLLLVNNSHAVPSDISDNMVRVSEYVGVLVTANTMNENALVMLRAMLDSAADAGFNNFIVTHGYRTHEQQQNLFDTASDTSFVSLPGHSEHQTGLAADISYSGVNISNSRQGTWLRDNSFRYGFILRYPQHKTDITGFPFEPWHFRYVGQPHAYFMQINDFVLEEYISHLREQREITVTFNDVVFKIYYLSNVNDSIEIPQGYSFSTSLDNTGGIIVTTWR